MKETGIAIVAVWIAAFIGATSCSKKAETVPGKQTTCPVMKGKTIDPNLYIDVDGKRIYACCLGCIATVKADPAKYISEMEAEGVILEDAPQLKERNNHER